MAGNRFELPTNRLATADTQGRRIYLYPAEVTGYYQRLRKNIQPALIVFFLVLPWLRIAGRPLLLLDIAHQRFTFAGRTLWAHDAPLILFLVGGFTLGIAFITAVWGRVWCGWACPQTVFIESVFRRIERWIEGPSHARRRSDEAPWSAARFAKKSLKWTAFLLVTLVISHSFVAYFVGTDSLLIMMQRSPAEAPGWFVFMAVVTSILLFDFGWFREQFCVIVCPYGRLQSLFLDEHSRIIYYDRKRGEPRKGTENETPAGDCVNCYRCVQVCPTGVDIRRGNQLECVACTACIDACDEVMQKISKPKGLIRIESEAAAMGKKAPFFRINTSLYLVLLSVLLVTVVWVMSHRAPLTAQWLRASEVPYQEIREASGETLIINHFHVEWSNEDLVPYQIDVELTDDAVKQGVKLVTASKTVEVNPGNKRRLDIFVTCARKLFVEGTVAIEVLWHAKSGNEKPLEGKETLNLVGPLN